MKMNLNGYKIGKWVLPAILGAIILVTAAYAATTWSDQSADKPLTSTGHRSNQLPDQGNMVNDLQANPGSLNKGSDSQALQSPAPTTQSPQTVPAAPDDYNNPRDPSYCGPPGSERPCIVPAE